MLTLFFIKDAMDARYAGFHVYILVHFYIEGSYCCSFFSERLSTLFPESLQSN